MKLLKKGLLLSLLLTTAASQAMTLPSFLIQAKNKTTSALNSIKNTIKSDLGFAPQVPSNDKYSLSKDFWMGARLASYSLALQLPLTAYNVYNAPSSVGNASSNVDASRLNEMFFLKLAALSCVVSPILEEFIFTYLINNWLGAKYGPIITPFLFGAGHFSDRKIPMRGLSTALLAGTGSYFRTRNFHANPKHYTLAPIFSHAIHNGVMTGILLSLLFTKK